MTPSRPSILQIGARWFPEVPAGLERVYYDLVRHLPKTGFDVDGLVLANSAPGSVPGLAIKAYARPDASLPKRIWTLRRATQDILRSRRVALIGCHYPLYGFPIADVMNRVPTVFHFHGPWAAEGQIERNALPAWLTKRAIEQILYRRPSKFVVLSRAFRDVLIEAYGVPADRIAVIPGGVDMTRFKTDIDKAAARRALGLPAERPIVLTIRRLVRRMGLENLIAGIAEVARAVPDILLVIGGTGPLEAELRRQVKEHGVDNNIRWLGKIPDARLPLSYRAADISIVPSLALEGFGLTTVESLACGTPVLVTPVGGLPEVVADLSPHLVLRGCAPDMIAEGLLRFYGGALPVPDAESCVDYVRRCFDWPVIAERIADLYKAVLARQDKYGVRPADVRAQERVTSASSIRQ